MLNYGNLNDVEFEYLCQDLMQKKLGTTLHRFARGKDGGIDLADNVHTKNIVVQVKHYMRSPVEQLIASLKKELDKVQKLAPNQYYICCSKELTPQKINEIYIMFSDYMNSPANIITLNDIDDFLTDSANIDILKNHYKLWIDSTGILQEIYNTNIFVDCESLIANIRSEERLFVKTVAFSTALRNMEEHHTLFITGSPGVGKTITSKMLVLYYAANDYRVRYSTNVSDLDELKKSLTRNPDIKEIILVDDCFGQAYFNMKESQNSEILSLINYVNASTNKRLILNSRITILNEAKEQTPELLKCFEEKQCRVYFLDMDAMDNVEKARIFYNHITFNGMDNAYYVEIQKEKRYRKIVKHPNYTPRIMEFICNPMRYKDLEPTEYYDFVMRQLNNPREIWKDEYERKLQKVDRLLLQTLYSLSDSKADEATVRKCFENRIASESDIDTTINQYEAALTRLLDGFVRIVSERGPKKLMMVNPSINDYLDGRLRDSPLEKKQLIGHAFSIQQKKRLLSEEEFDEFAITVLREHEIEQYLFDTQAQKDAFISYYVCSHKVFDAIYRANLISFLNNPVSLHIYGKSTIMSIEIFRLLFKEEICKYYNIGERLYEECSLEQMLERFDFDALIEAIQMIDPFYQGANRPIFVRAASDRLGMAIELYCGVINADEFDFDVGYAVEIARYDGKYSCGVDVDKAASYLEEEIIVDVAGDIETKLSLLPQEIEDYQDYDRYMNFAIYGAKDMVNSYLSDDIDYDFYEFPNHYDDPDLEIDFIFNRA